MKTPKKSKLRIKTLEMSFLNECPRAILFIAEVEKTGEIAGTVTLRFTAHKKQCEFARLFTHPSHRQNGFARELLAAAGAVAKNAGALYLSAYVNKDNDHAMAFYERIGFIPIYQFTDGDHLIWRSL